MDEITYRTEGTIEDLARALPRDVEEVLEEELGAIMHAPDFHCYEVRKGGVFEQPRFVGFDVEGAGYLIELRNYERDLWSVKLLTEDEA